MKKFGFRYFLVVAILAFLFANFIACGSQLYKLTIEDDIDRSKAPETATDPASPAYGIHAPGGWAKLPIEYKYGSDLGDQQKAGVTAAMQTWEKAVGKTLFKNTGIHNGITGDSFKDLFSSLEDSVNGNYLDYNWGKTGKQPIVLATTIWDNVAGNGSMISRSDIRYNTQYYIIGDSLKMSGSGSKEIVDIESLALHELGHLLGLAHVTTDVDADSVMNPSLFIGEGLTTRKLSKGDFARIQHIYGCQGEACDVDQMFEKLEYNQAEVSTTQTAH